VENHQISSQFTKDLEGICPQAFRYLLRVS
jgi:hypothetical protein